VPVRPRRGLIAGWTLVALLGAGSALAQGSPGQLPAWAQPPQPQKPSTPQQPLPTWAQPQRPPQTQAPAAPASPVIAHVGGRPITQLDFDRVAEPYFQTLRAQLGPSFAGEVEKMAKFNVLDELVRRELLGVEAERQQIVATPQEVDSLLVRDPFFYTNGQFDAVKFASYKTSPGSNYQQVLPRLRDMASIRKLDESLRKRFTPTPAQLREEWSRRNDQVRLKMLALLTRDMSLEPEASEAEWAQYYQAHPDQFQRKTRARLRYARLPIPTEGDSLRAGAEAKAMARGRAIADSLRKRTLPDTSARLTDTGLFDLPSPVLPGLGRVPGLSDTLTLLDMDSTIRVVGPYPWHDAVLVGVVTEREPKHVPPMREVLGDVKRRADVEKRRTASEADRRAFYEAHRDRWRGKRAAITRIVFDPASLTVNPPAPADVDRWYAQHGHSLFGVPDTSHAWMPPISDSLRTVVRERMIAEQRAARGAETAARIAAGFRTTRDPRALARTHGAAAETLSFLGGVAPDTLFSKTFIDSLLAGAMSTRGTVQGPRTFGTRWASWRVDAADTAFVPPYEAVRSRSDLEFAEERRQKDEAEARAHFEQHRSDYKTPVRYGIDYVLVRVPPEDSIKIPEAEIRRRYDQNRNAYRIEEQVKARHILFMTQVRDMTPEIEKKLKARADSLEAAIRKEGGDFAELARRFSQEPGAATSGGDLGWFGRGRMVKEFEEAAFALKPGEISPVVKSQFGYHIIKVEERKAAGVRPFDEVRPEIRTQMAQARADSGARRSAETLRRKLSAGGDAKTLSARQGGVVTANPIAANDALPAIGFVQGLAQELPTLKAGKWAPHVYRGGNAWMVLRVRETVAPRPAEFDEVKAQATEDMKNARRRALLDRKAEAVRAGRSAGATLDSLAAPYGGLKDTGLITQTAGFVPPIGNEPRVLARAFAMKPGEETDTLQVAAGVAWVRMEEKKPADPAGYKVAAAQIEAEMVKKKYDAWVEEKKKSVPVQILSAELKGPRPSPFGGLTVNAGR
jgi:parvulin-like peptidyl-prolyl isomerase